MDATTLGGLLAGGAALVGAVVAYLGKRAENATARFNSVTDQVQEQLDRAQAQLATAQAELVTLHRQHYADLVEHTRLQRKIIELGGETQP